MFVFHGERHSANLEKIPRSSGACIECHMRKIRCDAGLSKPQCTYCQREGKVCKPWSRRKAHATKTSTARRLGSYQSPDDQQEIPALLQPNLTNQASPPPPRWTSLVSTLDRHSEAPPDPSPASIAAATVSSTYDGYMERSTYIAPDAYRGEDAAVEVDINYPVQMSSEIVSKICELQRALSFPPRAVRESLLENFWTYCYPWEPVVERRDMVGLPMENLSPLLLQAMFLVGSRMSSVSFATPQEFYNRAKTLFYLNLGQDKSLTPLIAVYLLHWWNPHGPERVSTDTSSFWIRVAVALAQQMGLHSQKRPVPDESLRRRIWWSLVARDCLIAAAQGRPQAINIDDCDLPRPKLEDFPNSVSTGQLFIAYVDLSLIIGRFVRSMRSSQCPESDIESALCLWVKTLPDHLKLTSYLANRQRGKLLQPYSFESRQLNVIYLVAVILLRRPRTLQGPFPATAVIAASTVAGIFEDFLARNEVQYLCNVFTFYLLTASISLLMCYKYPALWTLAQRDLAIIGQAQDEMKKKWPSTLGSIKTFERMYRLTLATQKQTDANPEVASARDQFVFFEELDTSLCRMWSLCNDPSSGTSDLRVAAASGGLDAFPPTAPDEQLPTMQESSLTAPLGAVTQMGMPDIELNLDTIFEDEFGQPNGDIGNWLFWNQPVF